VPSDHVGSPAAWGGLPDSRPLNNASIHLDLTSIRSWKTSGFGSCVWGVASDDVGHCRWLFARSGGSRLQRRVVAEQHVAHMRPEETHFHTATWTFDRATERQRPKVEMKFERHYVPRQSRRGLEPLLQMLLEHSNSYPRIELGTPRFANGHVAVYLCLHRQSSSIQSIVTIPLLSTKKLHQPRIELEPRH
jgi:hypothetical protein